MAIISISGKHVLTLSVTFLVPEKRVITCFRFQKPIENVLKMKYHCFKMLNGMALRTIMFFHHGVS